MRKTLVSGAVVAALLAVCANAAAVRPAISIKVARPSVVYGGSVKLSGLITSQESGQQVKVLAEKFGASTFSQIDTVTTTDGGAWSDSVSPVIQTRYEAQWTTAMSRSVLVRVRPRIVLSLQSRTSTKGTFSVKVSGDRSFSRKYVLVQRLSATGPSTVKHVVLGAGSSATFTIRLPRRARVRVVMPTSQAAPGYIAGYSNVWKSS